MTQKEALISYLLSGKSITPLKAWQEFGITRLAARIHELRKEGWEIESEIRRSFSGKNYARYSLKAAPKVMFG